MISVAKARSNDSSGQCNHLDFPHCFSTIFQINIVRERGSSSVSAVLSSEDYSALLDTPSSDLLSAWYRSLSVKHQHCSIIY